MTGRKIEILEADDFVVFCIDNKRKIESSTIFYAPSYYDPNHSGEPSLPEFTILFGASDVVQFVVSHIDLIKANSEREESPDNDDLQEEYNTYAQKVVDKLKEQGFEIIRGELINNEPSSEED